MISKLKLSSILWSTFRFKQHIQRHSKTLTNVCWPPMDEIITEINANHIQISNKITDLEAKIAAKEADNVLKPQKQVITEEQIQRERQRLINENNGLKEEVQRLVTELNELEAKRDPNLTDVFKTSNTNSTNNSEINQTTVSTNETTTTKTSDDQKQPQKSEKKPKKEPKTNANKPKESSDDNKPLDVSRLDLRVGRILTAKKHPDADALYLEEIDCGEEKPRTVVSGLVRFVPLEEMQNRLVIVLCNLKPAKMRGITSEAMVMCASTPEAVEILSPPEGSVPGDRVVFDKYPGTPDSQLNPKKKIWEQIAPDLKTNSECVATYKDEPFKIESKGLITSKSLANVAVK
ncbi:aminoacyl tRNA synthase complex-interacting multifunctional protein 1-like [Oppia nitens]|uniref:aminoacyl tRNA synthase complex-interacting multifunctional protein 1-like n=1 Tax=Oppia nitens TaxID=1686743 RepID=UPI0023DC93EB|nr:aminoacyl tRNA synthase complex-interacting multifunctional protein 1-like [Oppia nitens]